MRAMKPVPGGKPGELPEFKPTPPELDDRTPCPYCGRKFNDVAAQRHIPFCKNKSKENAMRKFKRWCYVFGLYFMIMIVHVLLIAQKI